MMLRRTGGLQPIPKLCRLGFVSGSRLPAGFLDLSARRAVVALALQRRMMLPVAVDEPVARGLDEKCLQLGGARKSPAGIANAAQDTGPNRLHDIERVEAGPHRGWQEPADHLAQIGFVG